MAEKSIPPEQLIASILEGRSRREVMVILGRLEHGGAGIYESLAAQEQNQKARDWIEEDYEHLARKLRRQSVDIEDLEGHVQKAGCGSAEKRKRVMIRRLRAAIQAHEGEIWPSVRKSKHVGRN